MNLIYILLLLALLFPSSASALCQNNKMTFTPYSTHGQAGVVYKLAIEKVNSKPQNTNNLYRANVSAKKDNNVVISSDSRYHCGVGSMGCFIGSQRFVFLNSDLSPSHVTETPSALVLPIDFYRLEELGFSPQVTDNIPVSLGDIALWKSDECN